MQGNTSNIVFLKSTDDSMIETLSKMSGTMHVAYKDSKTVTQDVTSVLKMTANEGKVSYTVSTVERPVIAYNDFAQIPPCNSIVFRAGDLPIWNRNETALPMSWRLFKNTIVNPGKEYTLQTIPSLSTAKDFDVKQNQPNFSLMFEKRVNQAVASVKAAKWYKDVYGLTDDEIQRLDVDVYSDAIMEIASQILNPEVDMTKREETAAPEVLDVEPKATPMADAAKKDDTVQKAAENDPLIKKAKEMERKIYAGGRLSPSDLMSVSGQVTKAYDAILSAAYVYSKNAFSQDPEHFRIEGDILKSAGGTVYMYKASDEELRKLLEEEAKKNNGRVFKVGDAEYDERYDTKAAIGDASDERPNMIVTPAFIRFLCSFKTDWDFAQGKFAERVAWMLAGRERD